MDTLACSRCKLNKPINRFKPRPKIKRKYDYTCYDCGAVKRNQGKIITQCEECFVLLSGKRLTSSINGRCGICAKSHGIKKCSSCCEIKTIKEFYNSNYSWCKQCIVDRIGTGIVARCDLCNRPQRGPYCQRCLKNKNKRYCGICDKVSSLDNFYNKTGQCRPCSNASSSQRGVSRFLPPAQYNKLLAIQGNQCAICGRTPEEEKQRLAIDHCHNTNEVRGVLCTKCNLGISYFADRQDLLLAAVKYLNAPPAHELLLARGHESLQSPDSEKE